KDDFPWTEKVEKDPKGVVVAPGGRGVVRLFWDGRAKREPEPARLDLKLWVSSPGKYSLHTTVDLVAFVAYVRPVRFHPDRWELDALSEGSPTKKGHFVCWSSTRRLTVSARQDDPCFVYQPRELTEDECRRLEEELRGRKIRTRIRSAYRVDVTAHETKG